MTVAEPRQDRGWREGHPSRLVCRHEVHGLGYLDETARRLSHEEHAVATRLAAEGHAVRSLASGRGGSRTADLDVCGQAVEVKSWLPLSERGGRPATARSVLNKLLDAGEQGDICVLYGRGSGLTAATVRSGVSLYARRSGRGLTSIRAIGDGFDVGWEFARQPHIANVGFGS